MARRRIIVRERRTWLRARGTLRPMGDREPPKHVPQGKPLATAGLFVVSLDFELRWGVRDVQTMRSYGERILGVRQAIPAVLKLFKRYDIHATWAIVGFLLCKSRDELLAIIPKSLPSYARAALSPYVHLHEVGADERSDPYHFAPSLARAILDTPNQELATHTLSHFYCLEQGATVEAFVADLHVAIALAGGYGAKVRSIVFPRNQYAAEHLSACGAVGLLAYRGNPGFSMYEPRAMEGEDALRRFQRLADAYLPMVKHASVVRRHDLKCPADVPATRFLRPWQPMLRALEPLRMRRTLTEMTEAATHGHLYHLWWHPHNFGEHLESNLRVLERILSHARYLRHTYGMRSMTMYEAATSLAAV